MAPYVLKLIFIFSKEKTCDFYGFVSWLQTVILFISLYNLSPLKKKLRHWAQINIIFVKKTQTNIFEFYNIEF